MPQRPLYGVASVVTKDYGQEHAWIQVSAGATENKKKK